MLVTVPYVSNTVDKTCAQLLGHCGSIREWEKKTGNYNRGQEVL